MTITKFAFVGFPTKDMDAARKFWGELLGLAPANAYEDKWVEFDTPDGKTVALDTFTPEKGPSMNVYLSLETDDIEAEVARLKEAGVPVFMEVQDNKVCKMAIVGDPEGRGVMLHQIAPDRATC